MALGREARPRQLLTTLTRCTHNSHLIGRGARLEAHAVRGIRSHKMKQTPNTRRRGGGSHWGEWSGGSMLSGMRGADSRAGRENSEPVAKR